MTGSLISLGSNFWWPRIRSSHSIGAVMIELESPVRRDAVRNWRTFGLALIDRRQAAAEQHLAPQLQLFRRLVAGIDPARLLQPLELALIDVEPLRLTDHGVRLEAEPAEVLDDRLDIFLPAALQVGVVDPQQEPPAILQREQRIVQRGADIADMEPAGRRRGETGDDGHGRSP